MSIPDSQAKREVIFWLDEFLQQRSVAFSGTNAADIAQSHAGQQNYRWQQLLGILDAGHISVTSAGYGSLRQLRETLKKSLQCSTSVHGDRAEVQSSLPVMLDVPAQSKLKEASRFPFHVAAVLAMRCKDALQQTADSAAAHFLEMAASAEASSIITVETDLRVALENKFRTAIEHQQETVNTLIHDATEKISDFQTLEKILHDGIEKYDRELAAAKSEFQNLIGETREQQRTWETERKQTLVSLREEIAEFTKIEASLDLWSKKANAHKRVYVALSSIFSATLIALALLVIHYGSAYVSDISALPGEKAYFGLALIAIPVLSIAWVMRFIARLAIQNFALAHDARQRHAQINTYLRLLGDESRPIGQHERILALAALFRPLPGQGPDDVNPPTIADLLKEAHDQLSKARLR